MVSLPEILSNLNITMTNLAQLLRINRSSLSMALKSKAGLAQKHRDVLLDVLSYIIIRDNKKIVMDEILQLPSTHAENIALARQQHKEVCEAQFEKLSISLQQMDSLYEISKNALNNLLYMYEEGNRLDNYQRRWVMINIYSERKRLVEYSPAARVVMESRLIGLRAEIDALEK